MAPVPVTQQNERAARHRNIRNVAQRLGALEAQLPTGVAAEGLQDFGFDIDALRTLVNLWAQLLSNTHVQEAYTRAGQAGSFWLGTEQLERLDDTVDYLRLQFQELAAMKTLAAPGIDKRVAFMSETLQDVLRQAAVHEYASLAPSELTHLSAFFNTLLTELHRVEAEASFRRLEQRAEAAVEKSEDSASRASIAAGKTGESALASHYDSLAKDEHAAATLFRWLTAFLALIAGGGALAFVLGAGSGVPWLDIQAGDYVHLVQRGLLIAAILGLAGYFARQAHQHRSMANWSGSLAVQLKTFESYLSPIEDDEVKNELRRTFAARVFGDHPALKGESAVTPTTEMGEKAIDLAAKVIGR